MDLPSPLTLSVQVGQDALHLEIHAPFFDNAPPAHPPGSTPRLWEHEVVEYFILGQDQRYLEMEFGPHGHYLLLSLHGERNLIEQGMRCDYSAVISDDRKTWRGTARIPVELLPPSPTHHNAYAIHEIEGSRRYMAKFTNTLDTRPNFHRLETFGELP